MRAAGPLERRTTLLAGASQGMVKAIAKRFAGEGAKVVLVARSRERLAETAEIEAAADRTIVALTDVGDAAEVDVLLQREGRCWGARRIRVNRRHRWPARRNVECCARGLGRDDPRQPHRNVPRRAAGCCVPWRRGGREAWSVIGSTSGKRPLNGLTPYTVRHTPLRARRLGPDARARARTARRARQPHLTRRESPAASRIRDARASARGWDLLRGGPHGRHQFTPLRRLGPPESVAAAVSPASDASASTTGEDLNISDELAMY